MFGGHHAKVDEELSQPSVPTPMLETSLSLSPSHTLSKKEDLSLSLTLSKKEGILLTPRALSLSLSLSY